LNCHPNPRNGLKRRPMPARGQNKADHNDPIPQPKEHGPMLRRRACGGQVILISIYIHIRRSFTSLPPPHSGCRHCSRL
jgi:hypothetical protein